MATKRPPRKPARPRKPRRRRAVPPPDNPLLRSEELQVDRIVALPEGLAGARPEGRAAAAGLAAAPTRRPSATAGESAIRTTARLRVAALAEARGIDGGPPAAAAPATGARMGGPLGVAPVPGISNWVQLGPITIPRGQTNSNARVQVTGRITAMAVHPTDPNTIYVCAAQGGVWKTTDGGKHWEPKSDNEVSLAIGALAMDPSNPQVLYAGTGEGNFSLDSYYGNGILKTIDGGDNWTNLARPTFMGARFTRIAVTPGTPTRLLASTIDGLFRSTNGGTGWAKLTNGLPNAAATDVAIDPSSPATAYAAFWGFGVYKTTNAGAANPTWTKLSGGLPASNLSRIALGLSPSSPSTVYALIAADDHPIYTIDKLFRTTNGGTAWSAIALPGGSIGKQGFYNLNVAVDPTTPDIIFLSGLSLWRGTRNSTTGAWTIANVGLGIHADHHALAFDPANHLVIYAGNDGGIYKSADGGATWDDKLNKSLCITQYEFLDQHPVHETVVFGGTQDNGTEQFRNHPVFYHADDGDGGCCIVDAGQPRNVLSTYYGPTPKRSTQGGKFSTWDDVSVGIVGSDSLFYPPLVADDTNPNNVAIGTDQINLDAAQGTGGWPIQVSLPGNTGNVTAIHYVNSQLIYAATFDVENPKCRVYKLTKSGSAWTATLISAAPLPEGFIWDVGAIPGNPNELVVVMSGFGFAHVWRGAVPAAGAAAWTDISSNLPDIPVNALVIEPGAPDTMYIATDVAVYRTTNGGGSWTQFSQGLPNCAVFDLRLHAPSRLLRAGTHGRGLWERRLDLAAMPNADLYFRDHLMASGRISPSPSGIPAAFEDPLQHVALGDPLYWWMCADIKVDTLTGVVPSYQMPVADVDAIAFESRLEHRNPQRGKVNRVYVQVLNRGIQPAVNVTVKLLYADASAGLPPLPADFWTAYPNDSADVAKWKPIGAAKVVPSVSTTEPAILEWDWSTPLSAADHTCLLAIMDGPGDPIPASSKVFEVWNLVPNERRAGLKNVHVIDIPALAVFGTPLEFHRGLRTTQTIRFIAEANTPLGIGLLLPQSRTAPAREIELRGFARTRPSATVLRALRGQRPGEIEGWDLTRLYTLDSRAGGGSLVDVPVPKAGLKILLVVTAPSRIRQEPFKFTVVQEEEGQIVGGSTFVVRTLRRS